VFWLASRQTGRLRKIGGTPILGTRAACAPHVITIVGCGPGSPDYLTPAARNAIRQAGLLAGAERLLKQYAPRGSKRIVVGKNIPGVLDEIARHLARRQRIAVLVTGDPGIFSLAQPVIKRFGRNRCHVIPGVSSVQVAFARLGLDWSDARILSAHGRPLKLAPSTLYQSGKVAMLVSDRPSLKRISRSLTRLPSDFQIWICEDLTLRTERVHVVPRRNLAHLPISPRTIILLVKNSEIRNPQSTIRNPK
jgi:precorrin-6y C5,15-methyltransferase (decarboxylating) CbiE subunit